MKKIALILAALLLVSSLFACNNAEEEGDSYGGVASYSDTARIHKIIENGKEVGSFTYVDGVGKTAIITKYTGPYEAHTVVIPETVGEGDSTRTVVAIGSEAFYYCTSMTAITLPKTLEKIDHMAFAGCTGLTSITIPQSTVTVGTYAFSNCTSLKTVTFAKDSKVEVIDDFAFSDCSALESINLPEGLKKIKEGAFYRCEKLAAIKTPASLAALGTGAFKGCRALNNPGAIDVSASVSIEKVYVETDEGNVLVPDLGDYIFSGINKDYIIIPGDANTDIAQYVNDMPALDEEETK